ncbi:MAG TPA: PP2C family protein-serine/threonine phosphatase [Ignavibacteriales bacterium]|nr:PP2C family protein-serine/threonine phosphatase [Ignavibacteriales bacterium]HEX3071983.1 PP2C family protein-serine/threonine phosphatase [Ignavibacteriales bacterium]
MKQKKLYKTLEAIASQKFSSEEEMLVSVLQQLVEDEQFAVKGGRIWSLEAKKKSYKLLFQTGSVDEIKKDFILQIKDYPIFDLLTKDRTVLADETNLYLRSKGIFKYSASGIGSKARVDGKSYYEYMLALNSDNIDDELSFTLNIVATVLTSQLRQRRISESQRKLISRIDEAKELQKSILPEHEYFFQNYEMFGLTVPADTLGGDFFDYLPIGGGEERMGVAVGDVASKGIAAAAEAFYISGALRMVSTFQIKISPMMKRMNELINKIFSDDKFASFFYGELSTDKKGLFLYANAGHNPPIFIRQDTKELTYLEPTGPLLGPAPKAKYATENINFNPGDVLIIYTDGITEAMNRDGDLYEEDRLEEVILNTAHLSPKEIAYSILDDVIRFSADGIYSDDKTLVIIKRKNQ